MIASFPEILKVLGLDNIIDIHNFTAGEIVEIIKLYYHKVLKIKNI